MTDFPAYKHSVLDACQRLHGHACGSGYSLPDAELHELREWLRLRITEHWRCNVTERPAPYDSLVRRLAMAALKATQQTSYVPSARELGRAATWFSDDEQRSKAADMLVAHREDLLGELEALAADYDGHADVDEAGPHRWSERAEGACAGGAIAWRGAAEELREFIAKRREQSL